MKVVLLHENAKMPARATPGSAGFDLYAPTSGQLAPGAHGTIPLGICIQPNPGWYGRIAPRSGLAVRYGIHILAGVIDSDYTGEVTVAVANLGRKVWEWKRGDRIAQLILEWHYRGDAERVLFLDETQRGAGGFGSTGVA